MQKSVTATADGKENLIHSDESPMVLPVRDRTVSFNAAENKKFGFSENADIVASGTWLSYNILIMPLPLVYVF
jgi:hypothetical protein